MAVEFQMPKLGLTMEEGTITSWLVESGAEVTAGTPVLSIETDKVESDVEASHSGILHITGAVGELFGCGERIGWFLEPGETPPEPGVGGVDSSGQAAAAATERDAEVSGTPATTGPARAGGPGRDGARLFASPNARRVAAEVGVDLESVVGTGPGGRIVSEDVEAAGAGQRAAGGSATVREPRTGARASGSATTAAIQAAARLGVDLGDVKPIRADGRVDRADVERHVRDHLAGGPGDRSAPQVAEAPLLQEPTDRIPLTGMRGRIAQRMHESLSQMAQLTLTMDVRMGAVVAHRAAAEPDSRPGYTDYVVAAVAQALRQHPLVNSQVARGAVNLLPEINVGLAVALEGGLVVPVVHGADRLGFRELCAETKRLADAARGDALVLGDLEGGTFSVTALGMYGVDTFTPVVNPPNTAVLGVGRLRDSVRFQDGVAAPEKALTLSLTWDHRAYDGAPAAEFTATVRDLLENWDGRGGR
jgi:pyruvate dehydrogenase E2 component (dihydrolipoamide acetyltransferase)